MFGGAGRSQSFRDEVSESIARVDQGQIGKRKRHGIDGEVTAQQVVLDSITECHDGLAGLSVVGVASIGRDLDLFAPDECANRAKITADVPRRGRNRADNTQNLVGGRIRGEIEVRELTPQKGVAHRPADERKFESGFHKSGGQRRNGSAAGEGRQSRHGLRHALHIASV